MISWPETCQLVYILNHPFMNILSPSTKNIKHHNRNFSGSRSFEHIENIFQVCFVQNIPEAYLYLWYINQFLPRTPLHIVSGSNVNNCPQPMADRFDHSGCGCAKDLRHFFTFYLTFILDGRFSPLAGQKRQEVWTTLNGTLIYLVHLLYTWNTNNIHGTLIYFLH